MKYQDYVVKDKWIRLVNLADIHLGHKNCDKRMVQNVIEFIKTHKCYWVGGGDYGDAIIPTDKRFDFRSLDEELKTPQMQYAQIEKWFKPIAHKCLGLIDGNHDIIHWKKHAHNYVEELADRIGVPYLTVSSYLRLHFTEFNDDFNLYAHHGWTGARSSGGRINRFFDLFGVFPMLDLYIMNHVHGLGLVEKKTSLFIGKDGQIHDKISHFLYGGSFLRGYVIDQVSYVEEKTYIPCTLGSPVLEIHPFKGKHGVNFKIKYEEIR